MPKTITIVLEDNSWIKTTKRNYNLFLAFMIIAIAVYLVSAFIQIDFYPAYISKNHHDNAFNGYMIFMVLVFFWTSFVVGLFQIKFYLEGKERLFLASFIFGGLSLYLVFLTFLDFPMTHKERGAIESYLNFLPLICLSLIVLALSWTKFAQKIHLQSKLNKQEDLRRRLGI